MKIRLVLLSMALCFVLVGCGEEAPEELKKLTPPKAAVQPDPEAEAKAEREEYLKNLKARQAEPTWEQKKLNERGLKRGMSMSEIYEASKNRQDDVVKLKGE